MFDPLMRHYQRLYNIKPSAEIASIVASNKKRRKRQKTGDNLNHTLGTFSKRLSSILIPNYSCIKTVSSLLECSKYTSFVQ